MSEKIGAGELVYYKVVEDQLYIFGSVGKMLKPSKPFPVNVVFDDELNNPDEKLLSDKGYIKLDLEPLNSGWCLSDLP